MTSKILLKKKKHVLLTPSKGATDTGTQTSNLFIYLIFIAQQQVQVHVCNSVSFLKYIVCVEAQRYSNLMSSPHTFPCSINYWMTSQIAFCFSQKEDMVFTFWIAIASADSQELEQHDSEP